MMGNTKSTNDSEKVPDPSLKAEAIVVNVSESDSDCLVIDVPDEPEPKAKSEEETSAKSPDKTAPVKNSIKTPTNSSSKGSKSTEKPVKRNEAVTMGAEVKEEVKFDDVENAMAAMFAGCESESGKESPKKSKDKVPKKRGRKPKSETVEESKSSKPVKKSETLDTKKNAKSKKTGQKLKNGAKKRSRDVDAEDNSFKGPFVRITGKLESPDSVKVINHSTDLGTKSRMADLDLRLRVTGFGPSCSSTLSSKYDPKVVDESWICVFCKMGSHAGGLGDLFGPYFVRADVVRIPDGSPIKTKQEIAASFIIGSNPKKKKRKGTPIKTEPEVAKTSKDEEEVWFHEDCICWNPEIRMVGSHVFGMEDAIDRTQKSPCSACHLPGSTVCCIKPGCHDTSHFHCANSKGWQLNERLFQAFCQKHAR